MLGVNHLCGFGSSASSGPVGPSIPDAKTLLHFDGTNGSTTITDSVGLVSWTCNGSTQLSTAEFKYGTASLTGNQAFATEYVSTTAGESNLQMTGDLTLGFWFYPTADDDVVIVDFRPNATNGKYIMLAYFGSTDNVGLYLDGAADYQIKTSAGGAPKNQWNYLELSRSSGVFRLSINGTFSATTYTDSSTMLCPSGRPFIRRNSSGSTSSFAGYIDEFWMAPSAYHTSDFTPPTGAFTL